MPSSDTGSEQGILGLVERIAALPASQRALIERLFEVSTAVGRLTVPEPLRPKVARWYASPGDAGPEAAIERASRQRVVRTFNRCSCEGTLFNELRARRPLSGGATTDLDARIERAREGCDFCDPWRMTTADVWGRITGRHGITAANASMYEARHGMVVFREHHPHRFGREEVADYIETAMAWLVRTHAEDGAEAVRFPFIMWNCLEKAGASQPHGHLQMMLTEPRPYARQVWMMGVAQEYRRATGGDYWRDWVAAHEAIGLVRRHGTAAVVASLTPVKEKEVVLVGGAALDAPFVEAIADVLRAMIDRMGVLSFNAAVYLPPLGRTATEYGLPVIARVVDRGDPSRPTADVGAMELYGTPVVATDPYRVIEGLRTP